MYLPGELQGGHRCILSGEPDRDTQVYPCQENLTGYTGVSLSGEPDREDTGVSLSGEPDREIHRCILSGEQDREDTGVSLSGSPDRRTQVSSLSGEPDRDTQVSLSGEQDREDTGVSQCLARRYTWCISLSGEQDREDTGVSRQENKIGRTQCPILSGEPDRDTQVYLPGELQGGHRCICQENQTGYTGVSLSGEPDREDTGVSCLVLLTGCTGVLPVRFS